MKEIKEEEEHVFVDTGEGISSNFDYFPVKVDVLESSSNIIVLVVHIDGKVPRRKLSQVKT